MEIRLKLWLPTLVLISGFFVGCENSNTSESSPDKNFITKEQAISLLKRNGLSNSARLGSFDDKSEIREITPVRDEANNVIFYVANYVGGGFRLISADNRLSPILAYSDTNEFRLQSKGYNTGLVAWLTKIKDTIKEIRSKKYTQSTALAMEWDYYLAGKLPPVQTEPSCVNQYEQKGPLLQTEWNQDCGYNALMPQLSCNVPCGRAWAGCVPVAMAQVMRYHQFPTTYNWANMPNTWGNNNTALLINAIHTAIPSISYSCDGTGVDYGYNIANVFKNHFSYTTASQGGYNRETVKAQLRVNRPVILSGGQNTGWWIFDAYSNGHMGL